MAEIENELAWKLAASLADRIGDDRYGLYFDDQTFQLEHGTLLVQAANDFSLERISSQFKEAIQDTVENVLGGGIKIAYVVAGQERVQQSLFAEEGWSGVERASDAAGAEQIQVTTATIAPAVAWPAQIGSDSGGHPLDVRQPHRLVGRGMSKSSTTNQEVVASASISGPFEVSSSRTRLAPPVKQQLADQNSGQMSLFEESEWGAEKGREAQANTSRSTEPVDVTDSRAVVSRSAAGSTGVPTAAPRVRTAPGAKANMQLLRFQFGQANQLARAAVQQVLQHPGMISPIVIYGPVGCGKSHLANALGQQLRTTYRSYSVLHLSAEQFTSRFLEALNGSGLPSMRAKFRDLDLLVLEDIQFFQGKKATIIELQHTLDALIKSGKQLLLTTDRHPNDLSFLGSEVQTRLVSGLVVGLKPADREARAEVCRQWCADHGMVVEEALIDWFADHIVGDVRRICGALFRVYAMQASTGEPVTAATAMDLLSDYVTASHSICSLGQIQKVVCDVCGVDVRELNGNRRTRKISGARMLAMFLARKHTQAALSEIGDFFGGRRHSTVLAAEKRIKTWEQGNELMETGGNAQNTREVIRKVEAKLAAM